MHKGELRPSPHTIHKCELKMDHRLKCYKPLKKNKGQSLRLGLCKDFLATKPQSIKEKYMLSIGCH